MLPPATQAARLRIQLLADCEANGSEARHALAQVVQVLVLAPATRIRGQRAAARVRACVPPRLSSSACWSDWLSRYESFWLEMALSSFAAADLHVATAVRV
jgi:hypothetical protein